MQCALNREKRLPTSDILLEKLTNSVARQIMDDQTNASREERIVGELFTRLYLQASAPLQDSQALRNRLHAYFESRLINDSGELAHYLKLEGGFEISRNGSYYFFQDFFEEVPIEKLLSAITLIWRFYFTVRAQRHHPSVGEPYTTTKHADAWLEFVRRALHEENMAYTVDDRCGVHFVVDQEFERNRISALRCLEPARYAGARVALEAAHSYLDASPPDTKASVRSAFESVEIVARLIDPDSRNLNQWMVKNKLLPLALALANDDIEKGTISNLFEGISFFVHGLHNYRHGQGSETPIAPSLPIAIYVLSSAAATLRWLVLIDSSRCTAQRSLG
jgi:hypothetical protein